MLSIVIPAKNEEEYLPRLLKSIKKQSFTDYEIIVADANSTDKTREIALDFGCKITEGGLPGRGRNLGANIAQGGIIVFLDADTELTEEDFFEKALREFDDKKLDIAAPRSLILGNKTEKFFIALWNYLVKISQRIYPHAGGWCIFIKKEIHKKINGFDEKIILWEDTDYVRRAARIGKFRMLRNVEIEVSDRRLKKEGCLKVTYQAVGAGIFSAIFGGDRKNRFNYKFDIYNKKNK